MRRSSFLLLLPLLLASTVTARYFYVPIPYHERTVQATRIPVHNDLEDDDEEDEDVKCLGTEEINYMFPVLTRDPHATAETGIRLRICGGHECKNPEKDCPTTFSGMLGAIVFNEGVTPPVSVDEAYKALNLFDPVAHPYRSDAERREGERKAALGVLAPGAVMMHKALNDIFSVPEQPAPAGPKQNGIVAACKKWHVAKAGDSCYWIAQGNGIPLGDFYNWNPAVNEKSECQGLWVGYMYCVGV